MKYQTISLENSFWLLAKDAIYHVAIRSLQRISFHEVKFTCENKMFSREDSRGMSLVFTYKKLTMIPLFRGIWVGYNHLISNKPEWNNCFIKNAHKKSKILPEFMFKNSRFSACYFFVLADTYIYQIWRAWYNGSCTLMAKPMRALELHYSMI